MENLLQLQQLQKKLAEVVGITEIEDGEDKKKNEKQYADAIRLVYHSSQNYILNIAAKLFKGRSFDGEIPKKMREVPLPEDGPRDFELGDWIEVAVSLADFKTIQKATLGWNSRLRMVHGHVGIVTGIRSRYDNSIQLFFPEVFSGCSLHGGLLRKVDRKKHENYNTRWRPGEFVETVSEPRLAELLQRGLGNIPKQFLGGRGRIISITHKTVEVTFDEISCFHVNPAALLSSKDKTQIGQQRIEHARGFEIGDKVKMITNIKKLIQNQKEKGGWASDMTMLRGKEVTITSVLPDGTLHVQPYRSRAWRVSPDSVLKLNEDDPLFQEELGFVPGDIVKIKRSNDLRMILSTEKIPLSFLEFLRCPAKIGTIDDDFECYLLFDAEQHIEVSPSALRKTTKEEARKYWEIQKRVENLKVGEQVHLDVGPPNYVRAIVNKHAVEPDIKMALTKSAKIIGFIDEHCAVIEYEGGQRFKIKKKYLTIPDKFNITDSKEGVDLKTVQTIYSGDGPVICSWVMMAEPARTEHALFLLSSIEKMRQKGTISDFTIKVGGESIAVHRSFLAAISDYFLGMFTSGMKESNEGVVEMKDVSPVSVTQCLDYVYTGRVEITNETVADLLYVAAMMQIHGLVRLCEKFLEKNIEIDNCFLAMSLAERFDFDTVKKAASHFAVQHSDTVISSLGFGYLSAEKVTEYISKLDNCVKKWEAGITWAESNIAGRRGDVAEIFKAVGFIGCSFDFLFNAVWKLEWVKQDETIAKLVTTGIISLLKCSNITPQNCFELLAMANSNTQQPIAQMIELLRNFVSANFEEMSCVKDFKLLDTADVLHIFRSPESQHQSTYVKWKALIDWLKAGVKSRKKNFSAIFLSLTLENCDWDLLYENIYAEPLVQGCETSVQRVVSAMFSAMEVTDVSHSNWLKLLQLAHQYETQSSTKAVQYVRNFIVAHFREITALQDFLKLDKSDAFDVLDYEKTAHFAEEVRWRGAMQWIKGNLLAREADLLRIMDILSLENYSFKTLSKIYADPLVNKNIEAKQDVAKALLENFDISELEYAEVFTMLGIAKEHEDSSEVADEIRNLIVANLPEFRTRKEFFKLEFEELLKLLSAAEMRRWNPNIVWGSITKWVSTDMAGRKRYVSNLLKKLPLQVFPFNFLFNVIQPEAEKHLTDAEVDHLVLQPMFGKIAASDLNQDNWHLILLLATEHSKVSSASRALSFVQDFLRQNLYAISSKREFLQMEVHELRDLLSFNAHHSEDAKCRALLNWIRFSKAIRECYFRSLLKKINVSALSCEFLRNVLLPDPMVKHSTDIKDSIMDALLIRASQNPPMHAMQQGPPRQDTHLVRRRGRPRR